MRSGSSRRSAKTVQGEPRLDVGDGTRERSDEARQPAGGDHGGVGFHSLRIRSTCRRRATCSRRSRRTASTPRCCDRSRCAARRARPDGARRRGRRARRGSRRCGEDRAPEVLTLGRHGLEGGGRAEVDDDRRTAVRSKAPTASAMRRHRPPSGCLQDREPVLIPGSRPAPESRSSAPTSVAATPSHAARTSTGRCRRCRFVPVYRGSPRTPGARGRARRPCAPRSWRCAGSTRDVSAMRRSTLATSDSRS